MRHRIIFCLVLVVFGVIGSSAQTILQHMRLGNSVEDIAYIPSGPFANHIVIVDGMQFNAYPAEPNGNSPAQTLFDFRQLGRAYAPRGVAYIPEERLFIFTDPVQGDTTTMYLTDVKGNLKGTVNFAFPADWAGTRPYPEGIVWVPPEAPRYGGCFIFSGVQTAGNQRALFVMTRTGQFVAKITANVDPNLVDFYVLGLAYQDGRLFAGIMGNMLYELDLDGNVLAGPIYFDDVWGLEGVTVLRDGRVVVTDNANGKLIYLDANLNRLPAERNYRIGFGLGQVSSLAWNSDTSEFLANATAYEPTMNEPQIAAIDTGLSSSRRVVDLMSYADYMASHIDYLPDEQQIALSEPWFPPAFYFFDMSGAQTGFTQLPNRLRPAAFAYIPPTQQFVIRRAGRPLMLEIYDRSNFLPTPLRTIDLAPAGIDRIFDVAYFNPSDPSGGQFLVVGGGKLTVLDFWGNIQAQYNDAIGLTAAKPITSGPYAGAFAGIYGNNNELFIFTLP